MNSLYVRYGKRVFDIFVGSFLAIAFVMLFVPVAVAIKLDSPGPVIFRQYRVTQHGRVFQLYKFRSMRIVEESPPVRMEMLHEEITPVGAFLRKHRLDEFPQALNVLSGDMSIVGPRATSPQHVAAYEAIDPEFRKTLQLKAGLTSFAKVSVSTKNRIERVQRSTQFDIAYAERVSLLLDIRICIQTVWVVLTGYGAE